MNCDADACWESALREASLHSMPRSTLPELLKAALAARQNAYAPYSKFHVGACVKAASGKLYVGCNCENASYPVGLCAEACAIAAMVAAGEREIAEILVVGGPASGEPWLELVTPCGACRQRIAEFGHEGTRIHAAGIAENGKAGLQRSFTLGELLPFAFGL